jgi:hypothetical protein
LKIKVKVILTDGQSVSLSCFGFRLVGIHRRRDYGSVIYPHKCYRASPALSLLDPIPSCLVTLLTVSYGTKFALCCLLRLAGLQWRYFISPRQECD